MSILDQNVTGEGLVTPRMREAFANMSPWMRFIGIFGMIVCVLYGLMIIITLAAGNSALSAFGGLPFGTGIFLVLLIFIGLGFYLSLLIYQSGSRMKSYARYNDLAALEDAIVKQKNYWVIAGALLAIYLVLVVLFLVYLAVM